MKLICSDKLTDVSFTNRHSYVCEIIVEFNMEEYIFLCIQISHID